jgi:ABC-type Fe3+/spermidine/putrescine transport system ATPase subunit
MESYVPNKDKVQKKQEHKLKFSITIKYVTTSQEEALAVCRRASAHQQGHIICISEIM